MTDDWQWFWAGEGGRDRILRDEVEGLHAQLSSASSQTHRLSSQLASLSGSIETRLNALSEAFDAYVELGDVREELAAYGEPAAVRRSVMGAIDALAGGRPATPVDPLGLDYWLPYAMNAVIGLVDGRPDPAALDRARALAPEADTFVVATCGALGHGPAVADLLPTVLANDGELTEHQQRIWRAAATGHLRRSERRAGRRLAAGAGSGAGHRLGELGGRARLHPGRGDHLAPGRGGDGGAPGSPGNRQRGSAGRSRHPAGSAAPLAR